MIRRILDFTFILLFMWACMIIGLWLINEVIVPLELPGINSRVVTAIIKVAISGGLALFWLWMWREIIKRMFWHTLRRQGNFEREQKIKGRKRIKDKKAPKSGRD